MVLFLFVVMMLDINLDQLREGFGNYLPVGLTVAVLLAIEMSIVFMSPEFSSQSLPSPEGHGAEYSNTKELGMLLYTYYVYPFELAAVILLVAIVAAITLTLRRRHSTQTEPHPKSNNVILESSVYTTTIATIHNKRYSTFLAQTSSLPNEHYLRVALQFVQKEIDIWFQVVFLKLR